MKREPARCEVHPHHRLKKCDVDLRNHGVPDWPTTDVGWQMIVFDAWSYADTPGYCTGDQECSRSIVTHGAWEGFESALAWQILNGSTPGYLLDYGCNVGWYGCLAARAGRHSFSVDADPENCAVTRVNLARLGGDHRVACGWISRGWPWLPDEDIAIAKLDVEGAEHLAIDGMALHLLAQRCHFLLIELSPVFAPEATAYVVKKLDDWGYTGYLVPDKGYDVERFARDPLKATLAMPAPDLSVSQCMALFVP